MVLPIARASGLVRLVNELRDLAGHIAVLIGTAVISPQGYPSHVLLFAQSTSAGHKMSNIVRKTYANVFDLGVNTAESRTTIMYAEQTSFAFCLIVKGHFAAGISAERFQLLEGLPYPAGGMAKALLKGREPA